MTTTKKFVGVLVLALVALWGVGHLPQLDEWKTREAKPKTTLSPEAIKMADEAVAELKAKEAAKEAKAKAPTDTLGAAACLDFAEAMTEVDITTVEEFRARLKKVYGNGRYADTPAIRTVSREVLAASLAAPPVPTAPFARMTAICTELWKPTKEQEEEDR
jgi:hypothetical protein